MNLTQFPTIRLFDRAFYHDSISCGTTDISFNTDPISNPPKVNVTTEQTSLNEIYTNKICTVCSGFYLTIADETMLLRPHVPSPRYTK